MQDADLRQLIYDTSTTDTEWIEGIAGRLTSAFELDLGAFIQLADADSVQVAGDGLPFSSRDFHTILSEPKVRQACEFNSRPRPTVETGVHSLGHPVTDVAPLWEFLQHHGVMDVVVVAASARETDVTCILPKPATIEFTEEDYMVWYLFAVHLSAAIRLRQSSSMRNGTEGIDGVWEQLLSGEFHFAQSFHTNGRCVLVIQESNEADVSSRALSERERQVVELAGAGHTNKHIAYELGLSTSTVATYLMKGMTKLGIGSRIELVQHVGRLANANRAPDALREEPADFNFDELEAALRVCERELKRLSRMTPDNGPGDAYRLDRIAQLQRMLRALERVISPGEEP